MKLWQNYNRFWIESYFDYFNGYTNWTKKWLWHDKNPSLNNAIGVISMVNGVDVIGSNTTGDKQITIVLRYSGKGSSPDLIVDIGAIKFEFQEFSPITKDVINNMMVDNLYSNFNWSNQDTNDSPISFPFKEPLKLSGNSKIDMGWTSPITVKVDLSGNTTLNETNLIGINIHN
jgi:hypothetical protein